MAGIEGINGQSLYFAAAQAAARQQASEADKQKKISSSKKVSFSSAIEKARTEASLANEGLPVELAEMTEEDAIIFLKDELDISGDKLKEMPTPENVEIYRKKLSNFVKYIQRNNYEVLQKRRPGLDRRTRKPAYYTQINVINEKLQELLSGVLYTHESNIKILARVEEINGLVVDLLAS